MAVVEATAHGLEIHRDVFTQVSRLSVAFEYSNMSSAVFFQETFDQRYVSRYVEFSMAHRLRADIGQLCSDKRKMATRWLLTCFPPSQWMRDYKWKTYLIRDVISGLTVGVMNIPQGTLGMGSPQMPFRHGCVYRYGLWHAGRIASGLWTLHVLLSSADLRHVRDVFAHVRW